MIPENTYTYLYAMSSCVSWPLLCVTAGVRQAHQHLFNGYREATPLLQPFFFFYFFFYQPKDNYIKMPPWPATTLLTYSQLF